MPDYSERIRQIFVERYIEARNKGLDPDSIFCFLLNSVEGDSSDFGQRASALAILTYLFERCEVFEK